MARVRRIAALVGISASLLVVPTASAGAPTTLTGTVVVTAQRPSWVDVRMPRTATVRTPFDPSPDITVAGGGRVATFVLQGTDRANRHVTIIGGSAAGERFLLPLPQYPGPGGGWFEEVKTYPDVTSIRPGNYRLYVIPNGAPVRITLRLHGLSGSSIISPRHAATAEVATADSGVGSPASNAFAGTVNRRLGSRGLALQMLSSKIEASAAWQLVMCHNNPGDIENDAIRNAPGCPAGEKHTVVNRRAPDVTSDAKLFLQGFAGLPAGDHGISAVFTSQAVATSLSYTTVWLTY